MANDAVVPPVVGSVHKEMYGILASANCASFAEVFANCIKEMLLPSF